MLFKEVKKYLNKWKNIEYSWIGRLSMVKMSILPKLIYRFNIILIKITAKFCKIGKFILNFLWKVTYPRIARIIFKKDIVGGITLLDN